MKQRLTILTFVLLTINLFGQTSYIGYIDKYPIELVTNIYSDGVARAFYVYTKFDDPIKIDGTLKNGLLSLIEKDSLGKTNATLVFNDFKPDKTKIDGIWKDIKTSKELKITLTKSFDIDYGDSIEWTNKEILQPISLKDRYFKLIVSKVKGDFNAKVTGVKIVEKKTDKLIQQITNLECEIWGLDNVSTDDYNFDGVKDFSVFEQSYAGPNTSSLYFLFDSKTGKYFKSSFEGSSLEFDKTTKRIYEHNQCCAGRSHMNAEYKVVNNKMVLVKKTCLEYDEKTEDYKKVKCE
ncbi:XAC2610-related protein [Flavobacterium sp. LB2P74]|uniref:XAC2610-related protein n=1 Tax=Flavobacterium sp. LB2P74 TaxID=3401717 RepID=UPI003AAB2611